ncbi:MAG: hypothetical protein ABI837_01725, partial [Acidobacteriota bacterium]
MPARKLCTTLSCCLATLLLGCASIAGAAGTVTFVTGRFTENVATLRDPKQTYTLYLPSQYSDKKRWPLLLVFDPRQRGTLAAEIFREAAERHGWILVSSNQTRSDGDAQPNIDAINALWPEVHVRFATDPKRIYAAGFSGGGILALLLGAGEHLAGVIDNSGRMTGPPIKAPGFAHFGTAGLFDFNYTEMRELDDRFAAIGAPHRFESFDGPHRWMPRELAASGIEWMELLAMRDGLREHDDALIREVLAREESRAAQLEREGLFDGADRQYRWIVETFDGLGDVASARAALQRLDRDARMRHQHTDEKHWIEYEAAMLPLLSRALNTLKEAEGAQPIGRLRADLRIAELQHRASKPSFEGQAAQRVLESFFVQLSFYLFRDAVASKSFLLAATYLTLADEIKPRNPVVLYNLACMLSRSGQRSRAVAALRSA